jgi:hypothetical protein
VDPLYWKAHKLPVGLQTTSCSSCYQWGHSVTTCSNVRIIPFQLSQEVIGHVIGEETLKKVKLSFDLRKQHHMPIELDETSPRVLALRQPDRRGRDIWIGMGILPKRTTLTGND